LADEADEQAHGLAFAPVSGIMRGFIDLTFEFEGRYYIADYKSNWLGFQLDDYRREHLARVIREHRYDLQYLIYTLALHRFLKANLADYDYERHFGGVYYLFLRGLSPAEGANSGVFYDRPELALIERLDAMMWEEP
ncbi:MAG: exodeoxyribonuclease V subunit beta, partial [Gammaproteobacteria bacterium]|nr:exodeoxyribonuclease V subunit beta [Gammaproteobacteria bacterium]